MTGARRVGWLCAMWINTWATLVMVVGWLIAGLVLTGSLRAPWIMAGAIALAIVVPVLVYPWAKMLLVRILLRIDPPDDATRGTARCP